MRTMNELLSVLPENRDRSWENEFFVTLTRGSIGLLSETPEQGPDGWPYMLVTTEGDSSEPVQKMLHWLYQKGIGLAVNPQKEYPDYVFTYGMIWHFKETGLFYRDQKDIPIGSVIIEPSINIQMGSPTEDFLPTYVRKVLRDFFRDQGLHGVKILVIQNKEGFYDLAFSLESLGQPPEDEFSGIAEAIAWFLPPHYSILLISEKNLPKFIEL